MKRTLKFIFNTMTVVSLLLMIGVVGLWVDGYWNQVVAGYDARKYGLWLYSESGRCSLIVTREGGLDYGWELDRNGTLSEFSYSSLGFGGGTDYLHGREYVYVEIPHWFLTLIFAILPAVWLFKWNKRRKLSPNGCAGCGYDLTGNESGVCPECGKCVKANE